MSIPYNLSPLATHEGLPPGYTPLEFLEAVEYNSAYLQLGVEYFDILEIDIAPTKLRNRDYFAQAAQAGKYRQSIESYSGCYAVCYGRDYSREHGSSVAVVAGERVKILMDSVNKTLSINGTLRSTANLFAVGTTPAQALRVPHSACLRLHGLTHTTNEVTAKLIPALDPTGTPCMFDTVTRQAFKNSGSGAFIAGVGTVAQLAAVLSCLPSTGGKRTLSLPAEANTPEVAELLQRCHDTKGWTLTVHEYRPAATATYSLRRVREVVWCRLAMSKHGSYANVHGVRFNIERCAAIFGEHGQDPTDYGYEPFDSVEEAAGEWYLTPYIEPEMEELP